MVIVERVDNKPRLGGETAVATKHSRSVIKEHTKLDQEESLFF